MNSKIKIAFFDIDGTLINMKKKHMTEKTMETLQCLKDKNIILCVATGRGPMGLPDFPGIEFDAFLTFNGSYCFDERETIFSNPISNTDAKKIIENATNINRPISLATKDRFAANGKDEDLVEYFSFAHLEVPVADDFERVLDQEEIYQLLVSCRESDYRQLLSGVSNAKITTWWDKAADIIPANGGKGVGIEKILEFYHLDKSEAIAFGDGDNDIEMLQTVGIGVAMENGSERLKKVADDICGHVEKDGIYHYCLEHGLI